MTEDQRLEYLERLLYDCIRHRSIVETGEFHEMLKLSWRTQPMQLVDDVLTLIEWLLGQPNYNFWEHWPLPDRATVVKYLEITQRELRAIRALPDQTK